MNIPRQLIERKLSEFLGTAVTFESLSASVLGGSIEAHGVRVEGASRNQPLLTARRVKGQVSLGKALQKKIAVTSLRIEGMTIDVARDDRGKWNLPAWTAKLQSTTAAGAKTADDDAAPSWEFAVEKISLVDCETRVRIRPDYAFAAKRIVGELRQERDAVTIMLLAASAGRVEPAVEPGELRLSARFAGAKKLDEVVASALDANIEVADLLKAAVTSPAVRTREFSIDLHGAMAATQFIDLFPPGLGGIERIARSGRAEVKLQASYAPSTGVRVSEGTVRVTDVAVDVNR
jgi:hypothetical protein